MGWGYRYIVFVPQKYSNPVRERLCVGEGVCLTRHFSEKTSRIGREKCCNRHKEEIMGILDRSFLLQLFILSVLLM